MSKPLCGLCGNEIDGYGYSGGVTLCHPDSREKQDCYHLWTACGQRPQTLRIYTPGQSSAEPQRAAEKVSVKVYSGGVWINGQLIQVRPLSVEQEIRKGNVSHITGSGLAPNFAEEFLELLERYNIPHYELETLA